MERLMTETEAAERLGMSVHWLRRKRWEGGGPHYIKLSGGQGRGGAVRYLAQDIEQYLTDCRIASTSAANARLTR